MDKKWNHWITHIKRQIIQTNEIFGSKFIITFYNKAFIRLQSSAEKINTRSLHYVLQ